MTDDVFSYVIDICVDRIETSAFIINMSDVIISVRIEKRKTEEANFVLSHLDFD